MLIPNLKVPPVNTTLMGVVRGVSELYGYPHSIPMLYGISGHAFMINIHEQVCPSGPYCWKRELFYELLANAGIAMKDQGFFTQESSYADREVLERSLRASLDAGNPCAVVNMEFQLIAGYDEDGFFASQPWGAHDVTPGHITFSTWEELGEEVHANFFVFKKNTALPLDDLVRRGIEYALDVIANSSNHTSSPYYAGIKAYETWISAAEQGECATHGNWWNATVWSECRLMASEFVLEVGKKFPEVADVTLRLSHLYKILADALARVADKKVKSKEKVTDLYLALEVESRIGVDLERLVDALGRRGA